jgi:RHS repeat-associated protein
MLQSSFFDPVLGVDIHIVLVPTPAGPVPTPVPMPFVGMVFDPVGLAIGAAIGMATGGGPGIVLVNNLPVTNAGTNVTNKLTMPHLPVPGVAFARGLPGNDAELFFGSLNVKLAGSLGVRLGDIAMSCSDPVRLPTSVVLAIPKGMPVLNMPAMVPDLAGIAQRLVMMGAMRLLRVVARGGARLFRALRAAQRRSGRWARVSRAMRSVTDRIAPQRYRDRLRRAVCFLTGHPVDVATGRVLTDNIDFELPGPLPLVFERVYSSSLSWRNGPLGYGWSHSLDQQVWLESGKVVYLADDGREIEFHTDRLRERVIRSGQSLYDATNRLTLRALGNFRWEVESASGEVREFAPVPGDKSQHSRLQRIRSRDGHHSIQLTYSDRGHLEWVRDSGGRLIAFVHDKQGRLTEVKLPLSRDSGFYRYLQYVYGEHGDLVRVVDAAGHSWKFDYQGHLLVQETDRIGLSFYFQYDGVSASARCIRTWGDGGIYDHVIAYDIQGRKTVVEDSLGAATLYQMDELGMVVKVVDPHGAITEYAYDEDCGELARVTDALGHQRTTTYDERGNVVVVEGSNGTTVRLEYDARNLPVRATDVLGSSWTWAYDLEGHLTERLAPTGERTRWEWHKGLLVGMETPGGRHTLLKYDKQKNVAATHAPNGATTEYEYDGQGRVVRVKNARGAVTRFRYDVLSNVVRVEAPTGVMRELTYDAQGQLLEARDPTRQVRFRYGHFRKVLAREEAGATRRFVYDTEGRLTGIINEADEVYSFTLDARGEISEETGFDGRTRVYMRDKLGRVTKVHLPSGRTSEFTYDATGRLVTLQHSDGTGAEFAYRADGALLRATNESSSVLFERDALGRPVRERQGDHVVFSRFDTSGERTLMETSLGGRMAIVRDALGAVSTLHFGADFPGTAHSTLSFQRDSLGLETARSLPGGVRVEWRRDDAGRLTNRRTVLHAAGANPQVLDARAYQWRGDDQIAAIVDAHGSATHYQHDARGRLIAQVTPQGSFHRAMDAVGNVFRTVTMADKRYAKGGRLEESDGTRYIHDEDGNQTERLTADGRRWRYRWSGAGMLSEVERPDGLCMRFEYDAFSRRTRRLLVRQLTEGRETVEDDTRFVWDGHALVHEVPATGSVTTWYFEPASLAPVARERDGHKWAIASDHLGTPTEMYDEMGQLAWRMQLDVFGVGKADVALQHCPWRWQGQYEDEETELHYNRFRYYDPSAGRYISQDPLGLEAGLKLYGYPDDPLVSTDPLGLAECGSTQGLPGRRGALNQAKRDLGIPRAQHPESVTRVPMTTRQGERILNEHNQPIMSREYTYRRPDGSRVVIQDHSAGHSFGEGGVGDQGPHFNVRPPENTRTGSVPGTQEHYLFED